jgi:regulator of replication initiation timing
MSSSTNEQVVWNNSIYIPTIYKSIRKEDIVEFLEKDFGKVSNIDFVDLNENCRRAFVHFTEWYMDKGFGKIVRHNIETRGFCEFSMPIPNKYRKWFEGKMLINKNPLTPTDRKVKNIKKGMDFSFTRVHNLENTVNYLKSKISYLEDKLEEVISKNNEPYYETDKGPMDISELQTDNLENKSKKNKSKLISQGNYNTRIQNMFYDKTKLDEDTYCGYDRY